MDLLIDLNNWVEANLIVAHPFDPHRNYELPLNTLTPILPFSATIIYLLVVFLLPKFLDKIKAKPIVLRPVVALWNLGLSIFSLAVLVGVSIPYYRVLKQDGLSEGFCGSGAGWLYLFDGENPNSMLFWAFLFALSKYAELLDTLFLILRRKNVDFLHWFHHATVLLYTWYAEYTHFSLGFVFIVVNAFVHTFMYFYYFLSEIGKRPPNQVALAITIIQISQMVVGIASICANGYMWAVFGKPCMCDWPVVMMVAGVAMYGSYLFLFLKFFFNRYVFKKSDNRTAVKPTGKSNVPAKKANNQQSPSSTKKTATPTLTKRPNRDK